jgi:hypothetical protein
MACFARPDAPNPPIRSDDWPEGETVTLRPRLTWAIEAEAQQKSMRVPEGVDLSKLSPGEIASVLQSNMDATAALRHKLEAMIVDWTLRYEDGEPAPCTPEMIAQLPKAYADWIAAEIEKRGGAVEEAQAQGPLAMTSARNSHSSSETASLTVLDGSPGKQRTKPVS